jgi:aminoglycoside N3'-acetyltransferase/GrpB-like predicted nucleotidyltransferase (UPF0157 family)
MTKHVLLVPYDPEWPRRFEEERSVLAEVFAGTGAVIDHVGSTAVPHLGAKPIIDVMVGVPALAVAEEKIGALEAAGYEYVQEYETQLPHRRYFRKPRLGTRTFHVHCVVTGSKWWIEFLAFRDYLRAHRDAAAAYYDLKAGLATRVTRGEYTQAKAPFIERVLATALRGRRRPIAVPELTAELEGLGVTAGGVLLVHTSFSRIGPIEDGPLGLIRALQAALGPHGTLVMPSMSDDDDHPFDRGATPCLGMGVVADTFWRLPGVLRSNSPHAFAAIGPEAIRIAADHPLDMPHGLDSPVGRVYDHDGQVLLLGVGHDANTTIHLAEALAGVRYRRPKSVTILEGGKPTLYHYGEIDHCCAKFNLVDQWLDADGRQRRGQVGYGEARIARSRDVVATVGARLRENETVFLHEPGVDSQCDEARASLDRVLTCGDRSRH